MQKTNTFFEKFAKIFLHGFLAGIIALSVFVGGIFAVAKAAENQPGGAFGKILNKILASGNWQASDGTVKNAKNFDGISADKFQQIAKQNQQCPPNMCMTGFDHNGEITCASIK